MSFLGHPSVVFVETLIGDLDVEAEADITRYTLAFDYLRAAAAGVEESRDLIVRARDEIAVRTDGNEPAQRHVAQEQPLKRRRQR